MPGHDKSKIVGWNQRDLYEFECDLCRNVLKKPVVIPCCRQTYCRDCIDEWLKERGTCPIDRKPLSIDGLSKAPRLVTNLINKMQIKCDYSDKGCPAVTTIKDKRDHNKICTYKDKKTCAQVLYSDNTN